MEKKERKGKKGEERKAIRNESVWRIVRETKPTRRLSAARGLQTFPLVTKRSVRASGNQEKSNVAILSDSMVAELQLLATNPVGGKQEEKKKQASATGARNS